MQRLFIGFLLCCCLNAAGQELYVYSEPASNMPAHSVSAKFTSNFIGKNQSAENRFMQRYTPEVMLGISKKLMLHTGITFADMYTSTFRWESVYTYLKYRFLSIDDVHRHFRMAAFAEGSYSRNPFDFDELNFTGDKSGIQAGIIATQLWNRLAISGTASFLQLLKNGEVHHGTEPVYKALNYSFSSGYLVLPINYTGYKQTNMNVYVELLGQQSLDRNIHYVDLAPALQFIFNSTSKLNVGYRFQLNGNMERMTKQSWLLSYEYTFLNALKKKK
jgi:hypothetical protein